MPIAIADPTWTLPAATAAAWLATYAVHSTLLLGGAWLLARRLGGRRLAVQEAVWKLALVGGLLTATLQLGLGVRPLGGGWAWEPAAGTAGDPRGAPALAPLAPLAPTAAMPAKAARPAAADLHAVAAARIDPANGTGRAPAVAPAGAPAPGAVLRLLAVLALAAGLLALVPLALAHLRLARRLRGRAAIADGPLPRFLRRLERAAGLARPARLTTTPRLATPIARGVARGEICLPARALRELAPAAQEGVVAHELAHLARRDPAWLLAARVLERLLFVQPLNRLARRRLVEIAEYRCDDWAAGQTGRPLDLARCLTEVAGWSLPGAAPLPVPGIAAGSSLGRRVRRLLERPAAAERSPRWLAPLGACALAIVALAAPGVSRGALPVSAPPAAVDDATDDDAAEMIEEEIERGFDAHDEELEKALAPLEDLDDQLEPLEEELDRHLEALGEEFEGQMEALGEQMEAMAEQMAAIHGEHGERSQHGEAFAADFDPMGPELEAAIERLSDEMSMLGEKLGSLVEKSVDPALHERIDALVHQAMPSPETLDRIRAEAGRLTAEARSLADRNQLTEGERERLRLEARAVADLARPDATKLAELREQARQLAEQARPSAAELAALRSELEAKMPEIRERQREALERQREALERQREALDRQREEQRRQQPPADQAPAPPK